MKCGARVDQLEFEGGKEGPMRVFKGNLPYPGIVVTRTLGDSCISKQGVLCVPDVVIHTIDPTVDAFLVLASDGVWDGLTNDEVVEITRANIADPSKASRVLTKKSITGMKKRQMVRAWL
jgi:serine/threonine protein phosphatase PrpC